MSKHSGVCSCGRPALKSRPVCSSCRYQQMRAAKPKRLCECGCGALTVKRFVKGHSTRLLSSEEQTRRGLFNTGDARRDTGEGKTYRKLHNQHEHRRVAEEQLGRKLRRGEIVHHLDGNKRNNVPSNLAVMTQSKHAKLHWPEMMQARRAKHGY